MSFAWFLLTLGFVGLIIYVVWDYRRKQAARAAASSERFTRIFSSAGQGRATGASPGLPTPPAVASTPTSYVGRNTFLGVHHGRLFAALDAGLPDYKIFAHVSLAAVIELTGLPEGREREQRARGLAQQTLDCVVCSKAFDIVAVVDLADGTAADARFKAECLKAAGVHYLRWNPLELPPAAAVATLIAGERHAAAGGAPAPRQRDHATS